MSNYPLETKRHSLAHVLAAAVTELYPQARLAIGPAIDNGCYYDFDFGPTKLTEEALDVIHHKMLDIIAADLSFKQVVDNIDHALAQEKKKGQIYKAELIEDLKKQGLTEVSYYTLGQFTDLCRGPHVSSTVDLRGLGFMVHHLAGAFGGEMSIILCLPEFMLWLLKIRLS